MSKIKAIMKLRPSSYDRVINFQLHTLEGAFDSS